MHPISNKEIFYSGHTGIHIGAEGSGSIISIGGKLSPNSSELRYKQQVTEEARNAMIPERCALELGHPP
ncbi:MAG: hypothetical protein V4722_03915 [Bacteroidota bacterium]